MVNFTEEAVRVEAETAPAGRLAGWREAAVGGSAKLVRTLVAARWLVLLELFLLSPVLLYYVGGTGRFDGVAIWTLATSVLWLATFQLLARRPVYFFAAAAPFGVTVLADLFLILQFESRLTTSYLTMILEFSADALDFVDAYPGQVLLAFGTFVPLYALCLWKVRHITFPVRRAWAGLPLAALLLLYGAVTARQMRHTDSGFARAALDVVTHDTNSPFGVLSQGFVTWRLQREAKAAFAASGDFRFGATREDPLLDRPEVYVLVIGETSRPDRWSVNGYERETSPRLARLDNLVSFRDVVTQSPSTSHSVPLMITRATADDDERAYTERSIVSAFKEVGFRTFWFSTQEVSHWAGFIHHYAAEADVRRYYERRHDEVLLHPFEEVLAGLRAPTDKAFVVLHGMGSHFAFENRYPAAFRRFPESGELSRRELLWNTYDNSILYTDWFLGELIERLQARPDLVSALVFVSDHGENLLDDDRGLFGHAVGTEYDLRVASFLWYSDGYARLAPEAVASARARRDARLSTANVFHSLADLARIRAPGFSREASVFSPTWSEQPRLFIARGKLDDYDRRFGPAAASRLATGEGEGQGEGQGEAGAVGAETR